MLFTESLLLIILRHKIYQAEIVALVVHLQAWGWKHMRIRKLTGSHAVIYKAQTAQLLKTDPPLSAGLVH